MGDIWRREDRIEFCYYSIVCVMLFIVIGFFYTKNQLNQTSWQELEQREIEGNKVSICLDDLNEIKETIANKEVYSLLKKSNDCLKRVPYFSNKFQNLNIYWIEEVLSKDERVIVNNRIKELILSDYDSIKLSFLTSPKEIFIGNTVCSVFLLTLLAFAFYMIAIERLVSLLAFQVYCTISRRKEIKSNKKIK